MDVIQDVTQDVIPFSEMETAAVRLSGFFFFSVFAEAETDGVILPVNAVKTTTVF